MIGRRIDVHQHIIPPFYREALASAGIADAGGRPLPDWSPEAALAAMKTLRIATAIVSVSTPGAGFLTDRDEAADMAARLNDFSHGLGTEHENRFGFFATLPMPDIDASVVEAERALDELGAAGVTVLANTHGVYAGSPGQDRLWRSLNERGATVFVHPADLPAPPVEGIPPFAADFLLDTTRAAYLLVRNGVVRRYPDIRFVLSHSGGFVPYSSHRMAVAIADDTGRTPLEVLRDFRGFYFDTALSSSPAALPTLLAFAKPGHVLYGSDWPFAPTAAARYFTAGLESTLRGGPAAAIDSANVRALIRRLPAPPAPASLFERVRSGIQAGAARTVFKLMQPPGSAERSREASN
ncbi:amidohydrolase family protein [Nocardiopsis alba]|uniref:amidohydrolase family protein n=1 Tax=Nocardiopsis alba TaxID=53437 RepID=UPI0005A775AA|nr:amidohydrolase family protein [Nocardiopsis alba]